MHDSYRRHDVCRIVASDPDVADDAFELSLSTAHHHRPLAQAPERWDVWHHAVTAFVAHQVLASAPGDDGGGRAWLDPGGAPTPTVEALTADLRAAVPLLEARERLVVAVHTRAGLAGSELAEAFSHPPTRATLAWVTDVLDRSERHLVALLVVRWRRHRCADLRSLLDGGNGPAGPLGPDQVALFADHLDRCRTCQDSRRTLLAVLGGRGAIRTLAATPLALGAGIKGGAGPGRPPGGMTNVASRVPLGASPLAPGPEGRPSATGAARWTGATLPTWAISGWSGDGWPPPLAPRVQVGRDDDEPLGGYPGYPGRRPPERRLPERRRNARRGRWTMMLPALAFLLGIVGLALTARTDQERSSLRSLPPAVAPSAAAGTAPAPGPPGAAGSVPSTSAPAARLVLRAGDRPLSVVADASASRRGPAALDSYAFAFGDGTVAGPGPTATARHTFGRPGTYVVTLTVTDVDGRSGRATIRVNVAAGRPPQLAPGPPPPPVPNAPAPSGSSPPAPPVPSASPNPAPSGSPAPTASPGPQSSDSASSDSASSDSASSDLASPGPSAPPVSSAPSASAAAVLPALTAPPSPVAQPEPVQPEPVQPEPGVQAVTTPLLPPPASPAPIH